jgi:hypothetical protein
MSGEAEQTRQADWIEPPMFGGITALTIGTTAVIIDLTTMAGCPGIQTAGDAEVYGGSNPNPLGHYITLQADGGDIYVAFGDTTGHLAAVSTTAVSTVASNNLSAKSTANGVAKIFSGTQQQFKLPIGSNPAGTTAWASSSPARFMAVLTASGTNTLRMWQSSP